MGVSDDGRLLVLLAAGGLAAATAVRGSRGTVRGGHPQRQPATLELIREFVAGRERYSELSFERKRLPRTIIFRVEGANDSDLDDKLLAARDLGDEIAKAFSDVTCLVDLTGWWVELHVTIHEPKNDVGSRGVVRTSRAARQTLSLADRIAKYECLEIVRYIDENGVLLSDKRTRATLGEGAVVFARCDAPRPRPGWILLGDPFQGGFWLFELVRDIFDEGGQDEGLAYAGLYVRGLWLNTPDGKRPMGGEHILSDHPLISRVLSP